MNPFENLTEKENDALLKFPAYISLLAANDDGNLDDDEILAAVKFAHIKTFSAEPQFAEFYKKAYRVFENNIKQLDNDLPKEKDRREAAIKSELVNLGKIVKKLGKDDSTKMIHSMESFKNHVSKAHHNVLMDFIFPVPIHGLTE